MARWRRGKRRAALDRLAARLGNGAPLQAPPGVSLARFLLSRDPASARVLHRASVLGSGEIFALSALSKAFATVATYPMLVVKAQLQAARRGDKQTYSGTFGAVAEIARSEGLVGFFKGMGAKVRRGLCEMIIRGFGNSPMGPDGR